MVLDYVGIRQWAEDHMGKVTTSLRLEEKKKKKHK